MICPECVKPKLAHWDGTSEQFWTVIDRYIHRDELESDWDLLSEVLNLALLSLPYAQTSTTQVSDEEGAPDRAAETTSTAQGALDQAPGEHTED